MKKENFYITVFSKRLYTILKQHNIFPFETEPNRKFPQYNVWKYEDSQETKEIIAKFRAGEFNAPAENNDSQTSEEA